MDAPSAHPVARQPGLRSGTGRVCGTVPGPPVGVVQSAQRDPQPLEIAFVNLMPDTAFSDTEEQFLGILSDAARRHQSPLRVRRYWIRGVPRGASVMRRISRSYLEIDTLIGSQVDGLIVTGTEPRAETIEDEAFWPALAQLIEWSSEAVPSVLLSCLAAHAAAKLFQGVERTLLPQKLSGVFRTERAGTGAIAQGLPTPVWLPHSRSNDIPTSRLTARGYRPVLTAGESWTALEFERSQARFLVFQGHPEYAGNSLLREHRRDVRRYLNGERPLYPPVPEGYLDQSGLRLLEDFAALPTTIARDPAGLSTFPTQAVEAHIQPTWRHVAETLYGNWLAQVQSRRAARKSADPILKAGLPRYGEVSANA
ncbi:MAG TPA: homoserine O-succinyltransferase [Candidatus Dormibacteraeota bacterium]|nr:homoserine O-succinyltransferase [Candidatus Dormibacteraeota bacterium]